MPIKVSYGNDSKKRYYVGEEAKVVRPKLTIEKGIDNVVKDLMQKFGAIRTFKFAHNEDKFYHELKWDIHFGVNDLDKANACFAEIKKRRALLDAGFEPEGMTLEINGEEVYVVSIIYTFEFDSGSPESCASKTHQDLRELVNGWSTDIDMDSLDGDDRDNDISICGDEKFYWGHLETFTLNSK